MTKTVKEVEAEVKAAIATVTDKSIIVYAKACKSRTEGSRFNRPDTGMFQIEVYLRRPSYNLHDRSRDHFFRTKKDGTVPTDKIAAYVKEVLEMHARKDAADADRAAKKEVNKDLCTSIKDRFKNDVDMYVAPYEGMSGTNITPSLIQEGKIDINLGSLTLTEAEANELIDFLAKIRPMNKN